MNVPDRDSLAGLDRLNAAFWDLGLRFQWDEATWNVLVEMDNLQAQIAYYLANWQPHLLAVYDPAFLAGVVENRVASGSTGRTGMEALTRA